MSRRTTFFAARVKSERKKEDFMFLIIGLVLLAAWIGGFVIFHTAGFLIHLLLVFALISAVIHFVRPGRQSA